MTSLLLLHTCRNISPYISSACKTYALAAISPQVVLLVAVNNTQLSDVSTAMQCVCD
jgi:hypothetical protein